MPRQPLLPPLALLLAVMLGACSSGGTPPPPAVTAPAAAPTRPPIAPRTDPGQRPSPLDWRDDAPAPAGQR